LGVWYSTFAIFVEIVVDHLLDGPKIQRNILERHVGML
jgi:hypothetical protein